MVPSVFAEVMNPFQEVQSFYAHNEERVCFFPKEKTFCFSLFVGTLGEFCRFLWFY